MPNIIHIKSNNISYNIHLGSITINRDNLLAYTKNTVYINIFRNNKISYSDTISINNTLIKKRSTANKVTITYSGDEPIIKYRLHPDPLPLYLVMINPLTISNTWRYIENRIYIYKRSDVIITINNNLSGDGTKITNSGWYDSPNYIKFDFIS